MSQWTTLPVLRAATFSVVAIALVGGWRALLTATWRTNSDVHILLEMVGVCLAAFVGVIAVTRHTTMEDRKFLFIGTAFLGAAVLDALHAFAGALESFPLGRSTFSILDSWSWLASRLYLSSLLALSWTFSRRQREKTESNRRRDSIVWIACGLVCLGAILVVSLAPLPQIPFPASAFPRPLEFVPAAIFGLALWGYSAGQRWHKDQFESWLVLGLIVSVVTHALYLTRSAEPYDAMFTAAHVLKVVSYACVAAGIVGEVYATFRQAARATSGLHHELEQRHQVEDELQEERRNLRLSLEAVKGGMWWWDLKTGEIKWDNRMHELFGLKTGQFGGTPGDWKQLVHPEDAERADRRRREALDGKESYDHTYRAMAPTGRIRFIRDRAIVLRNPQGAALRMVGHCVDVTQRVRATQELSESEARFRSIADHAPVAIWMADKNKRLTYFNRQWLEFTGRTTRQEQGEGWALGVHSEDRQNCMDTLEAAFRQRQRFQVEFRLRRHDGVYCWMNMTGSPRLTDDGEILGYIGSCVNITELTEAMQSLRITQFALDRAPDAVFWVRPDGHFVYVNDEACRALQYSAGELLELRVSDVDTTIPPPQWPAFWERIKHENVVQLDTRICRKDGSEFPAELTIGFVETPAGEMACAFARDVTERRRQQAALRASEERFELAVKGTREGLWDWTPATGEVWFSDRNAEMLGYASEEFPHTLEQFNSLLHADDFDRTWDAVRRHFDTGSPYDVEFRLRAKDGSYRWFRSRGIAIHDEEDDPYRMVGSLQDIQDRKEAQLALEASNQELRQLAYIASHDLQEPLQAVVWYCGLLARDYKGRLDPTADEWLKEAVEASKKLQAVVKELLERESS